MTGLLLLVILVASLVVGLETHHRQIRREAPSELDAEVRRELRALGH
jgi:hypothetical protein